MASSLENVKEELTFGLYIVSKGNSDEVSLSPKSAKAILDYILSKEKRNGKQLKRS